MLMLNVSERRHKDLLKGENNYNEREETQNEQEQSFG